MWTLFKHSLSFLASLSRKFLNYYLFCNRKSNFLRKSESIKKSDESVKKEKPRKVERRSNGNKKRFSSFLKIEAAKILKCDLLTKCDFLLQNAFVICDKSNKWPSPTPTSSLILSGYGSLSQLSICICQYSNTEWIVIFLYLLSRLLRLESSEVSTRF